MWRNDFCRSVLAPSPNSETLITYCPKTSQLCPLCILRYPHLDQRDGLSGEDCRCNPHKRYPVRTSNLDYLLCADKRSHEIPEMIAFIEPVNSGFCITDPTDRRYQYIHNLRHRFAQFLHKASLSLQKQGEENTVDAVQMLVSYKYPFAKEL
jgi:hypothetical protein